MCELVSTESNRVGLDPLEDVAGACRYLRIGRTKLFELVKRGELVPSYVGHSIRFEQGELRDYVRRRRREDPPLCAAHPPPVDGMEFR